MKSEKSSKNSETNDNDPQGSARFRFKYYILKNIWVLGVVVVIDVLGIFGAMKNGFSIAGTVAVAAGNALFLSILILMLIGLSDIVVDDQGISRVALGITLRKLSWEDVKAIRILTRPDSQGSFTKLYKVFQIDSKRGSRLPFLPGGSIIFNDKVEDIEGLIELIKGYASSRNISIESEIQKRFLRS